jgi:hypothetical protein
MRRADFVEGRARGRWAVGGGKRCFGTVALWCGHVVKSGVFGGAGSWGEDGGRVEGGALGLDAILVEADAREVGGVVVVSVIEELDPWVIRVTVADAGLGGGAALCVVPVKGNELGGLNDHRV